MTFARRYTPGPYGGNWHNDDDREPELPSDPAERYKLWLEHCAAKRLAIPLDGNGIQELQAMQKALQSPCGAIYGAN